MKPDITTVRIEKRQNRAQILAFAFQESLEEGLFCRSPVVNEVVLEGVFSEVHIHDFPYKPRNSDGTVA
jgi:hypothetical protein